MLVIEYFCVHSVNFFYTLLCFIGGRVRLKGFCKWLNVFMYNINIWLGTGGFVSLEESMVAYNFIINNISIFNSIMNFFVNEHSLLVYFFVHFNSYT